MAFGLDLTQLIFLALLLLIPVLYELNGKVKYYVKMVVYVLGLNMLSIFVIVMSLRRPFDVENCSYIVMCVKMMSHLFNIEMEICGEENLVGEEPCVLVANHQTSLDFMGMMAVWPLRCTALAKRSLQYMIPFGLACTLSGTVFVDRGRKGAVDTMSEVAKMMKEKKINVFVFPEGTRNRDGGMIPFKKGAFHLAIKAQVPVLPLVFSSYNDFYSKKETRWEAGKLTIKCLPKIPTEGLGEDDVQALSDRVREQMLQVLNDMSKTAAPQQK